MIRDYKPSWSEEIEIYSLCFYRDRDGGLAFPCDENGNVDVNSLPDAAKDNYAFAMANPDKFPYAWNVVEKRVGTDRHPASGKCNCGRRINLTNDYLGACECPHCGQWWNLFGEELKPMRTWKNGDDW